MKIVFPLFRGHLHQFLKAVHADISRGEQKLGEFFFGEIVLLFPFADFFHAVVIADKIPGRVLMCPYLASCRYPVESEFRFVQSDYFLQRRPVTKQHQIRTDPHGSMMPPVCDKEREERIFREDILECALGPKAGPFQKRHQLGSDFDRLGVSSTTALTYCTWCPG